MPLVEAGVKYPREVERPFGLPPGWKAIERAYGANAKTAGQTYIRFDSPSGKSKNVGSVKSAITKDAEERGLDPSEEVRKWEQAVNEEKEAKQKEREEAGFMDGQKLEDAIRCFQATYGSLTGATVCNLPGWRGESKVLENCGQNAAMYYSPEGQRYPLLKNIEARFGRRMLLGLQIPDIEAARKSIKLDENGKPINVARKENIMEIFTHQEAGSRKRKRRQRRKFFLHEVDVADEDFQENDNLKVHGVADASGLVSEAEAIHKILLCRGFDKNTQLIYVTGKKEHVEGSDDFLDYLSGVYYQKPREFNGRPYFQKIALSETLATGIVCGCFHLFWSAERSCWKLGKFDENLAGIARCFDDKPSPLHLTTKWSVYRKGRPEAEEHAATRGDAET